LVSAFRVWTYFGNMASGVKLPQLNTLDCAELMLGARPWTSRQNRRPAVRENFKNHTKMHELEKTDSRKDGTWTRAKAAQKELDVLFEIFPGIDKQLVNTIYTDTGMNLERSIELFIAISSEDLGNTTVITSRPDPPILSANGKDWPVLTTTDGWQIHSEMILVAEDVHADTGCTWKDALKKTAGPFESNTVNAKSSIGCTSKPKESNLDRGDVDIGDPNAIDYEAYKKLTHKRLHRFAKSALAKHPQLSDDEAKVA